MRSFSFMICVLILLFTLALAPAVIAQDSTPITCEDSLPSRLVPGGNARVTPGDPNRVRSLPSTDGDAIGEIPGEGEFWVLLGPACVDGFAWWYVQYGELLGWTAEGGSNYWLEPVGVQPISYQFPESETYQVDFNNISFEFSSHIAPDTVVSAIVPDNSETGTPDYAVMPEHTLFIFEGALVNPQDSWSARITVSPVEEYKEVVGLSLEGLEEMLAERPDEPEYAHTYLINAAIIFAIESAYVDFENGSGVRSLVHYAQNFNLLTDEGVRYIYSGLTDDGRFLIQANIALNSSLMPLQSTLWNERLNFDAFTDVYQEHIDGGVMMLENAPIDHWQPTLAELDALVASINVGAVGVTVSENEDGSACETLNPRLIVDEMAAQALAQDSLRVRAEPAGESTGDNVFPGELVYVTDGPTCIDDVNWWQIEHPDGWTGWVAEAVGDDYFFDPVTRTPTPTITPTPSMTYTPSPTATYRPYITATPWITQCELVPFANTRIRLEPHVDNVIESTFRQGQIYYADAQYQRPGEDFPWWRVVPRASVNNRTYRWVRADFVTESDGCEGLPQVDPYENE